MSWCCMRVNDTYGLGVEIEIGYCKLDLLLSSERDDPVGPPCGPFL
jgi:hypothetical protein